MNNLRTRFVRANQSRLRVLLYLCCSAQFTLTPTSATLSAIMASLDDSEPPSIDPYAVLQVPTTATSEDIRKAYRRHALRLHPDKAAPSERDTAHKAFQDLAFAYAVLSDERRRKRYDATGNTSETLDIEDDDFNWLDFFRAQFAEVLTTEKIDDFKTTYQGSEEEKADVLKYYAECKGSMGKLFECVMMSNEVDDEVRFRGYIDAAIENGDVEAFDKYTNETEASRKKRRQRALREKKQAEAYRKELSTKGTRKSRKSKGKGEGGGSTADLAAMIQQRQSARSSTFLDDLEAKYAGGNAKKGAGKRKRTEEPPEEAFANTAKRMQARKDELDSTALTEGGKRSSRRRGKA